MSTSGKLIPFGYTIPDAETRLQEIMSIPDTLLLDIRFRPVSRYRPQWNKKQLIARWGKWYAHNRKLGNINYRDRSQLIVLVEPEPTITEVAYYLEGGYNVVVMCACKEYDTCHRKLVIELIQQRQVSFPHCPECGELLTRDPWGYPCIVEGQEVCETCMIVYELFHTKATQEMSEIELHE